MNRTERYIYTLLTSVSINHPDQLNIDNLSIAFNLPVIYWEFGSELARYRDRYRMFINQNQSKQEQWQDFCHEFKHYDGHFGNQDDKMPTLFYRFQEDQANYFAYHLAIPTFMLQRIRLPPDLNSEILFISDIFNVEPDFAARRLEMLKNKQLQKIVRFF